MIKNCQGHCPECGTDDVRFIIDGVDGDVYIAKIACMKCDALFEEISHLNYAETETIEKGKKNETKRN